MKLLSRTIINYFWLTIGVLLVTGFLLFGFLYIQVYEEIKEQLQLQEVMVSKEISAGRQVNFPLVKINPVPTEVLMVNPVFKDTLIYDQIQKKKEGYYLLRQPRLINGQVYLIEVMTTHIGWSGYSRTILYIFILIAVSIVLVGSIINYFSNRKMLSPFFQNLERLKAYSISANEKLELVRSNIDEFKEFNQVIEGLTERAGIEYRTLKEFTENASHEIQTPLSIVRTRLESMSQQPVDDTMARFISDAKAAIGRLSKVNKGLLLLAKIENQIFPDEVALDLKTIITQQVEQREDIILHKHIKLKLNLFPCTVKASPSLMEVLISNLLSNMLDYSSPESVANISLDNHALVFSNQAPPLDFEESKLFVRFGKNRPGYTGNGLGLPIVKQICKRYQWDIVYRFAEELHSFKIVFPSSK